MVLQREWAYRRLFRSNDERLASLPRWLDTYNGDVPMRAGGVSGCY